MTEASVADLNPHNLRKMHQFGNFRYDPGKYTSKTTTTNNDSNDSEEDEAVEAEVTPVEETTVVTIAVKEETKLPSKRASTKVKKDGPDGGTVLATDEDEYDAPWNQYAWIQELQLRVRTSLIYVSKCVECSKRLLTFTIIDWRQGCLWRTHAIIVTTAATFVWKCLQDDHSIV